MLDVQCYMLQLERRQYNGLEHVWWCTQVGFMTYAFGGPEEYHGRDMWRAHEKLVRNKGLNDHHFDVIVKHLVGALQKFNVPEVSNAPKGFTCLK